MDVKGRLPILPKDPFQLESAHAIAQITPADVSADADNVEMVIRFLDEALGIYVEALSFKPPPLIKCSIGRHVRADPSLSSDHPVPRQNSRFLWRQLTRNRGHMPWHDVHVHRDGAIGREFASRNQGHQAENFSSDTRKGFRFGFGHV